MAAAYHKRYYQHHKDKWRWYSRKYLHDHPDKCREQHKLASQRYYYHQKERRTENHQPKTSVAKRRANYRWKTKHRQKQLMYQRRSKCKRCILTRASLADLDVIEETCQRVKVMLYHHHRKEMQSNGTAQPPC